MLPKLSDWQRSAEDCFGKEPGLHGLYWIGSLAHGGFSERFSDIDVVLLYKTLPPARSVEEKIAAWKTGLPEGERWSIFWSDSNLISGRMPTPDRIDLLDNGKLFYGEGAAFGARPSLDELRAYLRNTSIPYWRELAHAPPAIDEEKRLVRLALYPARFAFSWNTGRVVSNEEAVGAVLPGWPLDRKLLGAALRARSLGHTRGIDLPLPAIQRQLEEVFRRV